MVNSEEFKLTSGYVPGSIGRVAELHGKYYHAHWRFGLYFEGKVASELAEFLMRFDPQRDGFWTFSAKDRLEGALAIDGIHLDQGKAHLRWFIVSDVLRGRGLGRRLMQQAIDFCRQRSFATVYLWTFEGLGAARHLYELHGFKLLKQHRGVQWGTEVNEQYYELTLS